MGIVVVISCRPAVVSLDRVDGIEAGQWVGDAYRVGAGSVVDELVAAAEGIDARLELRTDVCRGQPHDRIDMKAFEKLRLSS